MNNWKKRLKLKKHPEGGYYAETYRSKESIATPRRFTGKRSTSTAIYYLLEKTDFSSFHRIKSDELWHHYDGCGIMIHILTRTGRYKKILLGKDKGMTPQAAVSAGDWFASELNDKSGYALAGCTVAPGFDFKDFELASASILTKKYPRHKELISRMAHQN